MELTNGQSYLWEGCMRCCSIKQAMIKIKPNICTAVKNLRSTLYISTLPILSTLKQQENKRWKWCNEQLRLRMKLGKWFLLFLCFAEGSLSLPQDSVCKAVLILKDCSCTLFTGTSRRKGQGRITVVCQELCWMTQLITSFAGMTKPEMVMFLKVEANLGKTGGSRWGGLFPASEKWTPIEAKRWGTLGFWAKAG